MVTSASRGSGRAAVHEYVDGAEGRFMRALKSILGSSLMKETTAVGRERMSFEALIGRFLSHLKVKLEAETGADPLLGQVGWSWLVDSLRDAGADFRAEAGTVTRVLSEGFGSLAEDCGERAIGIVLSGTGSDGALGLKAIKERGGLTLSQGTGGSAPQYHGMPDSAVATGAVDLIVPVDAGAPRSVHLAPFPEADESQLAPQLSAQMALVRRLVIALCVLAWLSVAYARLYRGAHHTTDVLFGVVNGVACAVLAWGYLRRGEGATGPEATSAEKAQSRA